MADTQTLRAKLEAKKKQLEAKLKMLAAREAGQRRKDETRRKIIVGALAMNHAELDGKDEFRRELYTLVNRYTTRPQDRALFNLEPLETPAENEPPAS
jgi:hypothetical protein